MIMNVSNVIDEFKAVYNPVTGSVDVFKVRRVIDESIDVIFNP